MSRPAVSVSGFARWVIDSTESWAGTVRRHQQTAEVCFEASPKLCRMIADPDLNEYDHLEMLDRYDSQFGTPDGTRLMSDADAESRWKSRLRFAVAFARWVSGAHDQEYGESFAVFRTRCLDALNRYVPKLLERTGIKLEGVSVGGLNEAFAVQVLCCADRLGIPADRLNVDGVAIAVGPPYGVSGARRGMGCSKGAGAM